MLLSVHLALLYACRILPLACRRSAFIYVISLLRRRQQGSMLSGKEEQIKHIFSNSQLIPMTLEPGVTVCVLLQLPQMAHPSVTPNQRFTRPTPSISLLIHATPHGCLPLVPIDKEGNKRQTRPILLCSGACHSHNMNRTGCKILIFLGSKHRMQEEGPTTLQIRTLLQALNAQRPFRQIGGVALRTCKLWQVSNLPVPPRKVRIRDSPSMMQGWPQ